MSYPERYRITPATVDDADEIGTLHVAVWRQTYAGVMDDTFLAQLDVDEWRADWVRQLSTEPSTRVFVARDSEDANRLVGFTSVGPARDTPAPKPEELYVLNVDQSSHGSGVAQRLITTAIDDRASYLWVVDGNERAIRFYQKFGFELRDELKWDAHSLTNDRLMTRD